MEYEAFVNDFMKQLQAGMGDQVELIRRDFPKINGVKDGISIVYTNTSVSPTVYLDDKYEAFERGLSIPEISEMTIFNLKSHREDLNRAPDTSELLNSKNLYCSLINAEMNKDLLSNVPHKKVEDLAIIARCRVGDDGSFLVTNDMCSQFKMTSEELIDQAKSNTLKEQFECYTMSDVMRRVMEAEGLPNEFIEDVVRSEEECPMYVLSNKSGIDGATAMLSNETLESVREKMGEDFFILPSSRHELILVPESKVDDPEFLKGMVNEVNSTSVPKEDILSNSVYKYDSLKKAFSTIREISIIKDKVSAKLEENMNLMTSTKTR